MIKIIDFDALFSDFAPKYIKEKMKGLSPKQIEERIDEIYKAFGNEKMSEFDGKNAVEYYNSFGVAELCKALNEHLEKDIAPSSYLCDAISNKDGGEEELVKMLSSKNDEAILYAMNLLNDKNYTKNLEKYIDFILWDYVEPIKELATEILSKNANLVKDKVLEVIADSDEKSKQNLLEILSYTAISDDVYAVLEGEFVDNDKNIPFYAHLLSRYGDERAVKVLTDKIEQTNINYADFLELKNAIEVLGGEYNKKRDFSTDKDFLTIKKEKEEREKNKYN